MRHITQMILHLMNTCALTDEACSWLEERNFFVPGASEQSGADAELPRVASPSNNSAQDPSNRGRAQSTAKQTDGDNPSLGVAELEARIRNMRENWDGHLEALLPLAQALDDNADIDSAPARILQAPRAVVKELLKQYIRGWEYYHHELWVLIQFPPIHELVQPATEGPLARAFVAALQADAEGHDGETAWMCDHPEITRVPLVQRCIRLLRSLTGELLLEDGELMEHALDEDFHPLAYWVHAIIGNARLHAEKAAERRPPPGWTSTAFRDILSLQCSHSTFEGGDSRFLGYSHDGTVYYSRGGENLRVCDARTHETLTRFLLPAPMRFSKLRACCGDPRYRGMDVIYVSTTGDLICYDAEENRLRVHPSAACRDLLSRTPGRGIFDMGPENGPLVFATMSQDAFVRGSYMDTFLVWPHMDAPAPSFSFSFQNTNIRAYMNDRQGRHIVVGRSVPVPGAPDQNYIEFWDIARGKVTDLVPLDTFPIAYFSLNDDNSLIMCGAGDGSTILVETRTGRTLFREQSPHPGYYLENVDYRDDSGHFYVWLASREHVPHKILKVFDSASLQWFCLTQHRSTLFEGDLHWREGFAPYPAALPLPVGYSECYFSPDGREMAVEYQGPGPCRRLFYDLGCATMLLLPREEMELPSHPFDWRAAWLFCIEMNNPEVTEYFLHLLREVPGFGGSLG